MERRDNFIWFIRLYSLELFLLCVFSILSFTEVPHLWFPYFSVLFVYFICTDRDIQTLTNTYEFCVLVLLFFIVHEMSKSLINVFVKILRMVSTNDSDMYISVVDGKQIFKLKDDYQVYLVSVL